MLKSKSTMVRRWLSGMCPLMVLFNVFLLVYWGVEDVCPRSISRRTLSNMLYINGYCHPVLTPARLPYSTTAQSVMSIFRGEQRCTMPVRRCSLFHLICIHGSVFLRRSWKIAMSWQRPCAVPMSCQSHLPLWRMAALAAMFQMLALSQFQTFSNFRPI